MAKSSLIGPFYQSRFLFPLPTDACQLKTFSSVAITEVVPLSNGATFFRFIQAVHPLHRWLSFLGCVGLSKTFALLSANRRLTTVFSTYVHPRKFAFGRLRYAPAVA